MRIIADLLNRTSQRLVQRGRKPVLDQYQTSRRQFILDYNWTSSRLKITVKEFARHLPYIFFYLILYQQIIRRLVNLSKCSINLTFFRAVWDQSKICQYKLIKDNENENKYCGCLTEFKPRYEINRNNFLRQVRTICHIEPKSHQIYNVNVQWLSLHLKFY